MKKLLTMGVLFAFVLASAIGCGETPPPKSTAATAPQPAAQPIPAKAKGKTMDPKDIN